MTSSTEPVALGDAVPTHKPRFAYAFATVLGVGYIPWAPGTWGSAVGLLLAIFSHPLTWFVLISGALEFSLGVDAPLLMNSYGLALLLLPSIIVWIAVALLGVRTATQVAQYSGQKDPQIVVIDEVSGVHLALILGIMPVVAPSQFLHLDPHLFALYTGMSLTNWKYLLGAFITFRIFDILKPFPCRRLEKLPGGWGVMADDWMAGVYAAICLRIALHFYVL